ncbi:MAG TPA: PQQ-binding-like beta-propeller repeat protein [Mycobacteriales bacterium]|nr:PQQ-binding-like beta-propeller repeat protein [Mycobacteriales bacterium]
MQPRTALLALLVLLALTAGCTGSGDHRPQPTDATIGPDTPRLDIGRQALWTVPQSMGEPILHGDAVISWQAGLGEHQRLLVSDAATGRTRWMIDGERPVPGGGGIQLSLADEPQAVDTGSDWYVLVKYQLPACPSMMCDRMETHANEQGVVALSGVDGSVKWKTRLARAYTYPPRNEPDPHPRVSLRAASSRIAVATLEPRDGNESHERAVGLDPATGRIRWQAEDLWPVQVVGDTIVGDDRTDPGRAGATVSPVPDGRVAAFAVDTGKKRWDATYPGSEIETVAGDAVMIRTVDRRGSSQSMRRIVSIRDGARWASLPDGECVSDGVSVIGCTDRRPDGHFRLTSFLVSQRTVLLSNRNLPDDATLAAAWRGRIFLRLNDSFFAVDVHAHRIGGDLPGKPEIIGEHFAILRSVASQRLAVHRVAS